jgi:hypothetical protein
MLHDGPAAPNTGETCFYVLASGVTSHETCLRIGTPVPLPRTRPADSINAVLGLITRQMSKKLRDRRTKKSGSGRRRRCIAAVQNSNYTLSVL